MPDAVPLPAPAVMTRLVLGGRQVLARGRGFGSQADPLTDELAGRHGDTGCDGQAEQREQDPPDAPE
jgi:hypothetical protein